MKKFFVSIFVIVTFAAYTIHQHLRSSDEGQVTIPSPSQNGQQDQTPTTASTLLMLTDTPRQQIENGYKDGQYSGDSVDAFYGNVQVKTTISGGKITDVQFLDYPQDRGTSIRINSQAMPLLSQEAIQSQNATVDIVSGATQTSRAFIQSLQSALAKAK